MSKENGGNAFPSKKISHYKADDFGDAAPVFVEDGGMSLRDYFAAMALQGLLTQRAASIESPQPELAAKVAYRYADEMLNQRNN